MDLLKEHIAVVPKSQSRFGQLQFLLAFVSWGGVIGSLSEYYSKDKANFKCNANKDPGLVNQLCYNLHAVDYNSPFPQFTFALINGCVLIGTWIAFALYLGPRLVFFKRQADAGRVLGQPGQLHMREARDQQNRCMSVYCSYLLLIFVRVAFLTTMVVLLLSRQTFEFPKSFKCLLIIEKEHKNTVCSDAYFADKYRANIAMLTLDIILIFLAIVEAVLLAKISWRGGLDRDQESINLMEADVFPRQYNCNCCGYPVAIPCDAEFVAYLLKENLQEEPNETVLNAGRISDDFKDTILEKTKDLAVPLPLPLPFTSLNTDKLYTTAVLQSERVDGREISNANLEQLINLSDIFKQEQGNQKTKPRNILVYGPAGVGKSMFCQKLLRDWATGELFAVNGELRRFKFVFFLKFRELNYITGPISLSRLLNCSPFSPIDDETCRCIAKFIPSSMLIIFDGLDEFQSLSSCAGDLFNYADDKEAEMPVSAWYAKLVSGKILKGSTIITTCRPDALNALPKNLPYDKVVKLCGFTLEGAKAFIGKLLESEPEARDLVFELISSNRGIESLVCIPENCIIICCSFLYKVRQANENNKQSSTLTQIYDDVLHLFTVLHNPSCRGAFPEQGPPQRVLDKLFALAFKGIEGDMSLYRRKDLKEFALPEKGIEPLIESGLLQCLPLTQTGPACFETQYCFTSTMQEFLAAKHIVTVLSETEFTGIVNSLRVSSKWDMVIQFVAGLLKPSDEAKMRNLVRGLRASIANSEERSEGERLLLAARCCFEFNDDSLTSSELTSSLQGCIDLRDCQAKAADNRVVIYLLSRCQDGAIKILRMFNNLFGSNECEELGILIASRHGPAEELDLSNNRIRDDGVESLCRGLRRDHCTLQHLNLSGNGISRLGISCLLDVLKDTRCQLRTLNLAFNDLDHANARQLSEMLVDENFPLKDLCVASCGIDNTGVEYLVTALVDSRCHVQDLDLSDNNFTEHGMALLAGALVARECYIQSLKLRNNSLDDKSVQALTQHLTDPYCKVQRLNLAATGITDHGARYIASTLQSRQCKLKYLNISGNNFGNSGCSHIAKAVASYSSLLEELNMQQNGISDREALLFLNCFKSPKSNKLSSLNLSENNISEQGKEQLLCAFLDVEAIYWEQFWGKLYL
ncbi:uncharacterized protein LOC144631937 [Oculina patagonica]